MLPLQLSSMVLQVSAAAGLTAASLSLQSPLAATYPAGAEQAIVVAAASP